MKRKFLLTMMILSLFTIMGAGHLRAQNVTEVSTLSELKSALANGGSIKLMKDITGVSEILVIGKSTNLDGNSKTITSSAQKVLTITQSNVEVTISSLTLESNATMTTEGNRGFNIEPTANNVNLILNSCNVYFNDNIEHDWAYAVNGAGQQSTGRNITINGGTYEGANVINMWGKAHTVVIDGATLNCKYKESHDYCGTCVKLDESAEDDQLTVKNTTFNGDNAIAISSVNDAVEPILENNTDNTKYYVARIGENYYYSLSAAVSAAQAGQTITLIQDVDLTEKISIASNVVLNLNECSITADFDDSYGAIYVRRGAILTIEGNGNITSTGVAIGTYGEVNIKGGNITAAEGSAALYMFYHQPDFEGTAIITGGELNTVWNCGSLTINGGKIAYLDTSSELTIAATVENNSITKMIAKDGSDASGEYLMHIGNINAIDQEIELPEGFVMVEVENGVYKVVQAEAVIGTTYYATLQAAFDAAQDGDVVTLIVDVTLAPVADNGAFEIEATTGDVTLNLNGFDITSSGRIGATGRTNYAFDNYANLTIIGEGTITARGIQNYGTLTVDGNVTIVSNDVIGAGACIWAYEESNTIVRGGTFKAMAGGAGAINTTGNLEITGGTFESTGDANAANNNHVYAILFKGTDKHGYIDGDATFSNGRHGVIGLEGGSGEFVIENGTFTREGVQGQSGHVLYVNGDYTVRVNGGKFENKNSDASSKVIYTDENCETYIMGGTFTNVGTASVITNNGTTEIYGGTFSSNASQYCAPGLTMQQNANGEWIVVEDPNYKDYVAVIGDKGYETLQAALAAAQDGNEIDVIKDVTLTSLVKIEDAITLDLNQKTITANCQKAIEVYANATIKNGTIWSKQRCVDTRKAVELNLKDLRLEAPTFYNSHGNQQPLTIGGSEHGTVVNMTNVDIVAGNDDNCQGYGIITFVKSTVNVDNCDIYAYMAIYVKDASNESVFNVTNSTLITDMSGNDVEGNTTSALKIEDNVKNVEINIKNSSIVEAIGAYMHVIEVHDSPNTISIENCTIECETDFLHQSCVFEGNTILLPAEYADELRAQGYIVELVEEQVKVTGVAEGEAYICTTYGTTTYYPTLEQAIAAATTGDEIVILKDITRSDIVVLDKAVTLNGNYKTLTSTMSGKDGRALNVNVEGDVTVKNLTINASGERGINVIQKPANLTIENVTITAKNYAVNLAKSASSGENGPDVQINNSVVTGLNVINIAAPYTTMNIDGIVLTCNDQNPNEDYGAISINADAPHSVVYVTNYDFTVLDDSEWASVSAEDSYVHFDPEQEVQYDNVAVYAYEGANYYYSYPTLKEAIESSRTHDGAYIKVVNGHQGPGIVINKSITIDFNGKTYTFTEPAVGSQGTQTQGFQILKENEVTLKNGTLNVLANGSNEYAFAMLIQNYANLTIENMYLDGSGLDRYKIKDYNYSYVISNNCGVVNINGNTNIIANNDEDHYGVAFDVCKYANYDAPVVTVNTTGTIEGIIEVSAILNLEAVGNNIISNIVISGEGQLYHDVEGIAGTIVKTFENDNNGNAEDDWYTFASPFTTHSVSALQTTTSDYALYRYNEAGALWENVKESNNSFTTLDLGRGYIYANAETTDVEFNGTFNVKPVKYNLTAASETNLKGFHLVGNPFTHDITMDHFTINDATLASGVYVLENDGAWQANTTGTISRAQAVLIKTTGEAELTINKEPATSKSRSINNGQLMINVANSQYNDVAYVSFNEGVGLDKIAHRNAEIPMVYVPVNGTDYAIAVMNKEVTEIPVSFVANSLGQYTFSVEAQDCEFSRMYLYDRFTGETTNLLLEDYTFLAKSGDNAERFIIKLAFADDNAEGIENFALIYNGELIINNIDGEGIVRIYDVLGRPVAEYNVFGSANISTTTLRSGVYMIQMNDNNGVKVQKVIVD